MTPEEERVWEVLRGKRLGVKFRRQAIIRGWIVDFWCPELRLVIEVDGKWHRDRWAEDGFRDAELERLGIKTVRISNEFVQRNSQGLEEELCWVIAARRADLSREL